MAVFTPVTPQQADDYLMRYPLGGLVELTPIAEGVENTNYRLVTEKGAYVLTLFEGRTEASALPFCLGLTGRLAAQGCGNARIETADALHWANDQKFDAICVSGAVDTLPPRFLEWLKPGGRLFVVQGRSPAMDATLVHRDVNGVRTESLFETDLPYLAGTAPQPQFTL